MSHIYSLEKTIGEFFKTHPSATRQQCDDLAVSLIGSPITPSPIQGAFSYTVIAGVAQSMIVQFRAPISLLDMGTLTLARNIHPQFVAPITFHGTLGEIETSSLSVYVMKKISGMTYIEAGFYDESTAESRRLNTVHDFARYIISIKSNRGILHCILTPLSD